LLLAARRPAATLKPMTNRSFLLNYVDALQRGDADAIRDSFHEDATWLMPGDHPAAGTWAGRDAILGDFLGTVMARFVPDSLRFDVRSLTVEGDRAVLEWGVTARTVTGKDYDNSYLAVFELRDGRIAQVREYGDTQHIAEVMFG
jgi:uncharacterized protein (TIGR02246 family)